MRKSKSLALLLILLMITSIMLPPNIVLADDSLTSPITTTLTQPDFSDIGGHWAENDIKEAVTKGFVKGYSDGTFKPNNNVTRAEFVSMVNRALQLRDKNVVKLAFDDVKSSDWFYKDIQKASYAKYVQGVTTNSFEPASNIKRQEAAAMIARLLPKAGYRDETVVANFPDAANVSSWATQSLAVLINKGYMKGDNLGRLMPLGLLTRAEAVKIIGKVLANETIVTEDVNVATSGEIIKDKIYVGDIIIAKSVGNGDATLQNLSALSKVYVYGGGANTVTMSDSLIIQVIVLKEGTKVRVLSKDDTVIHEAIVFNSNILVNSIGVSAESNKDGYKNIININGTVKEDDAIKIAEKITEKLDSTGTLSQAQVNEATLEVLSTSTTTVGSDGVIYVNVAPAPAASTGGGGGGGSGGQSYIQVQSISITGTSTYGQTLTANPLPVNATVSYQWQVSSGAGFEDITSATSKTYSVASTDIGKTIKVVITGSGSYTGSATSIATSVVSKATLTVSGITAENRQYDGTTVASITGTAILTGIISDDDVSLTGTGVFTFSSKDVGENKTVTASGFTLDGVDKDNYDLIQPTGLSANITKKALTVSLDVNDKEYDGTTAASISGTAILSEVVAGDTVSVTGTGLLAFSDKNVGTNKEVTASGLSLTGSTAGNYEITTYTATGADITPKEITLSGIVNDKVYDATTEATISGTATLSGIIGSDDVTLTGTAVASFSDANAGTGKTVTISGYSLDGNDKDNYSLNATSTTASILKATPTIKTYPVSSKITYGDTLTKSSLTGGLAVYKINVQVNGTFSFVDRDIMPPAGNYSAEIKFTPSDTTNFNIVTGAAINDVTVVVDKREITVTADSASREYNGVELTTGASITSGTLVTGHAITATTTGSQLFVGSTTNSASNAVIKDGLEDVTTNYAISYVDGTLTVTKASIRITVSAIAVAGDEKVYDSTPLTSTSTYTGILATGDTVNVTLSAISITNVGTTTSSVSSVSVTHDGTDVTENYVITTSAGITLTVTQRAITITADSDSKTYDGTALTDSGKTYDGLVTGQSITATVTGSQITVGSSSNVVTGVAITSNSTDVTSNYNITKVDGSLTVTQRAITITAGSDSKTYDGSALTTTGSSITTGSLANGHTYTATVTGIQTDVGSSSTTVSSITIKDSGGVDVTTNYDISYANGTLTVNARSITITANSDSKTYDTTALTATGSSITSGTLVTGQSITATVTGSQINAGYSSNTVSSVTITSGSGVGATDVTSNYSITTASGTLTVNKKDPEVTWPTATKIIARGQDVSGAFTGGSSTPSGVFSYNPTTSSSTTTGSATVTVTFTPTDTTNYNGDSTSINVTVAALNYIGLEANANSANITLKFNLPVNVVTNGVIQTTDFLVVIETASGQKRTVRVDSVILPDGNSDEISITVDGNQKPTLSDKKVTVYIKKDSDFNFIDAGNYKLVGDNVVTISNIDYFVQEFILTLN